MAMAMGSPDGDDDAVISAINTTPLVDVMLVLLIIFLITSPIVIKTIKITLPTERNQVLKTKPENITIEIDQEGNTYWSTQKTLVALSGTDDLFNRLSAVAVMLPQPEVHIRADQKTPYKFIGTTILTAQRAAIAKVSFITDQPANGK